ncbi:MAG: hypothetical protein O3B65_00835 [Chloroflexi bacterium]|nr:hypothetical protein [Chloroflexota bacterium]
MSESPVDKRTVGIGVALVAPSWLVLWTQSWYLNPLVFAALWTGAALVMYGIGGGYPGVRRHLGLAAMSVPVWWWFELVNRRIANWEYVGADRYGDIEYALFATLSFATVIPALDSAWGLFGARVGHETDVRKPARSALPLIAAGVVSHLLVVVFPTVSFPLVWVGPLLILAGVTAWISGRTLSGGQRWRLSTAFRVALAGLLCGFLWELWNNWATPKWEYDVPFVDFLHIFEMPLLGYGGYVPFAWSIYVLVGLGPILRAWVMQRRQAGVMG